MRAQGQFSRRRAISLAILTAASAVPMSLCRSAFADRYWENGITADTWSSATDWSAIGPAGTDALGPPGSADNAYITNTDALNEVVTLDQNDSILSLQIGNSGGGSDTLLQNTPFNLSMATEQVGIGTNSVGVHTQSAGTNTYTNALIVASGTGSYGTYNLDGSGSINVVGAGTGAAGLYVGYNGTGTFNQTGGAVTLESSSNNYLYIGFTAKSAGAYVLSGGTLTVAGAEILGDAATSAASFNQTGGANTASLSLLVGRFGVGTYNLSGGTVSDLGEVIGDITGSSGTFLQSGGTNIAQTAMDVGYLGYGTYNLSGGTLLTSGGLQIGVRNSGTFNQTGGILTVTAADEEVGDGWNGTFLQSGGIQTIGTATVPKNLDIGWSGGAGTFILNGTGSVTINGNEYVGGTSAGGGGIGALSISGGSMSVSNTLTISSPSVLSQSNGSLTVANLNQSGGTITASSLNIGGSSAVNAVNVVSLCSVNSVSIANVVTVGSGGTLTTIGAFNAGGVNQVGGYTSFSGSLNVGGTVPSSPYSANTGSYAISGGTLSIAGPVSVGEYAPATFTVTGGSTAATGALTVYSGGLLSASGGSIGVSSITINSGGTLNWTGGSLTANALIDSGGTFSDPGSLTVGTAGNVGSATVSGGVFSVGALADTPSGNFSATSGTLSATSLAISGGAFSVAQSAAFTSGTVTQSGGVATFPSFSVGSAAGNCSSFALSGGTATFSGTLTVGSGGTFQDSGGSLSATAINQTGGNFIEPNGGILSVESSGGNAQAYTLAGGTLTLRNLNVIGAAPFNWTAGTLSMVGTINGSATLSDASGFRVPTGGALTGFLTASNAVTVLSGGKIQPPAPQNTAQQTISFDDLSPGAGSLDLHNNYGIYAGLQWNDIYVTKGASFGGVAGAGLVSSPNDALIAPDNSPFKTYAPYFSSASPFNLVSFYLTAPSGGASISIGGTGAGVSYQTTLYPSSTAPTLYTLNWSNITALFFGSSIRSIFYGPDFAIDNITVQNTATAGVPSSQTYTTGLDLSRGGIYDWQLASTPTDNTTGVEGTDFSQILVQGTLTLGGTSAINVDTSQLATGDVPGGANHNAFWNASHIWTVARVTGSNPTAASFASVVNGRYSTGVFATQLNADGKSIDLVYNEMNLTAGSGNNTSLGQIALSGSNGAYGTVTLAGGGVTLGSVDIAGLNPSNDSPVLVQLDVKGTAAAIQQWYLELSGVQAGGPTGYTVVPAGTAYGAVPAGDSGFVFAFVNVPGTGDRYLNFDWTAGDPGVTLDEVQLPAPEPTGSFILAAFAGTLLLRRRRLPFAG